MKKYSTFILLVSCLLNMMSIHAQDIIVKNDNDTIYCKILDVTNENIKYQIHNGDIKTTNTMNLKHIISYQINNDAPEANIIMIDRKVEPVFRIALGGGYARGDGKILKTNDVQLDRLTNDLVNGYNVEGDIEYYFNWKQKDALNFAAALHFNYINHHAAAMDIDIPNFGHANYYKESQKVCYIAPAFVMRYDLPDWLFTFSIGIGVIFFTNPIDINYMQISGNNTTMGSHIGIGADYKISPNWGAGIKFSLAGGTINSINMGGEKVKFDEPMSATSWIISGSVSFRTK
jgi:hypothetical protein